MNYYVIYVPEYRPSPDILASEYTFIKYVTDVPTKICFIPAILFVDVQFVTLISEYKSFIYIFS